MPQLWGHFYPGASVWPAAINGAVGRLVGHQGVATPDRPATPLVDLAFAVLLAPSLERLATPRPEAGTCRKNEHPGDLDLPRLGASSRGQAVQRLQEIGPIWA